jgi:hypothetical protein
MRRENFQNAAGLRNPMQLVNETEYIWNVLDHVATNDLFKFVIRERKWIGAEIVNHICMTQTIRVDADRARKFVLTTTDVEDLFAFGHRSVLAHQQSCKLFEVECVNRLAQRARHFGQVHTIQHYRVVTLQHLARYHYKLTCDSFARLHKILTG